MTAQLENGYTRIANELMDIIAQTKFNGSQFRIIMAVVRYTYGFNRKSAEMSVSYLAKATGLPERHVRKEVDRLLLGNILIEYKEPTKTSSRELGLNKNHLEWCICTSGADTPEVQLHLTGEVQIDRRGGEQLLHSGGVQLHPQERQLKDNIKDSIKDMLFEHWNSLGIIVHRPPMSPDISKALDKVVAKPDFFITCMDHYSKMYHDKNYGLCNYAWGLTTFIGRSKGYKYFSDDGEKWINYQNDTKQRASPRTSSNKAALVDQFLGLGDVNSG